MRIFILLLLAATGAALGQPAGVAPPPSVAAKSHLLFDASSRQTLAGQNSGERVEPASLTKLMSAYLTFTALKQKSIDAKQVVTVSPRAARAEGSRMFIEPRKPVTVDELMRGMIVQSGNDACIALAELIAGSEEAFVELMNRTAQRLGMKDTHFVNATGLPDPQHYSTAYDLALLAAAVIRDFPDYYPLYSLREFRYNNVTQANRNRLLWSDPTVDGMKTGYTENAGYCLIASAKRGERRLISVVLGASSDAARAVESQKLLNYGFQFYDSVKLYAKNQPVSELRVWKGTEGTVKAGFSEDLYVSVPRGQAGQLKASLASERPLLAPVNVGQQVGVLQLVIEGRRIADIPVVALNDVPMAGILGRGWDSIRLMFQ
jgi:serine-type D-Ala-D-Ala carboxypeptidase (penicillin-binding protein 5/6)